MQPDVDLNEAARHLNLSLSQLYAEMRKQGVRAQRRRDPNNPLSRLKTECISAIDFARLERALRASTVAAPVVPVPAAGGGPPA